MFHFKKSLYCKACVVGWPHVFACCTDVVCARTLMRYYYACNRCNTQNVPFHLVHCLNYCTQFLKLNLLAIVMDSPALTNCKNKIQERILKRAAKRSAELSIQQLQCCKSKISKNTTLITPAVVSNAVVEEDAAVARADAFPFPCAW